MQEQDSSLSPNIQSLIEQLNSYKEEMEKSGSYKKGIPLIQPLLEQLAPYTSQDEFIQMWWKDYQERVAPFQNRYKQYQKTLKIHWGILIVLALVPIIAGIVSAEIFAVVLLLIPVIGWYLIGIRGFMRSIQ